MRKKLTAWVLGAFLLFPALAFGAGSGIGEVYQTFKQRSAAAPTPASGYNRLYFKTDGKLYHVNSSGTESVAGGVQTATDCDQAQYYANGTLCQDTDDDKLYKGTGSAIEEVGSSSNATTGTVADTTDTTSYVALFESDTGDLAFKTDAALTYNATTGELAATIGTFGNLTVGEELQAYHASLASIASLSEAAGGMPYFTADNTWAPLAVGNPYSIMMVNSGGTAPSWVAPTNNALWGCNGSGVCAYYTAFSFDSGFFLYDASVNTKKLAFSLSGITATKTATLTFVNTDDAAITFPAATSTLASNLSKLSVFAATTSAELAGVISDETGSGAVMLGTSPSVTTSILPAAATTTLGSAAAEWGGLYLGDGKVIYFQADQSVYLTPSAGTLTLTGAFAATGTISNGTASNPYMKFDETDGTDWWIGVNDTTTDVFEIRTNATAGNSVGLSVDASGNTTIGGTLTSSSSATPSITMIDSDTGAAGTGSIVANSAGSQDIVLTMGVEDSTGESTTYLTLDGVNEKITASKPINGPVVATEVFIDCNGSADPYAYCTGANAATMTSTQVYRTIINSYGRGEAQTVTLPTAAAGMTFIAIVGTQHNSAWTFQPGGGSTMYLEVAGAPESVATISETNEAVGSRMSCATFKTGAAAWSWMCGSISGTWDHTN